MRNARVLPETYTRLAQLNQSNSGKGSEVRIFPGFYGATPGGIIGLLDDGGSDRSGSEVAVGVEAAVYENYSA